MTFTHQEIRSGLLNMFYGIANTPEYLSGKDIDRLVSEMLTYIANEVLENGENK